MRLAAQEQCGTHHYQPELYFVLPTVENNRDYKNRKELYERIDEILAKSGVESFFSSYYLNLKNDEKVASCGKLLNQRQIDYFGRQSAQIIRCAVARMICRQSYVEFSARIAESFLLQWFCRTCRLDKIRVPSKSQLQRFESRVPEKIIKKLSDIVLAATQDKQCNPLELDEKETFVHLDIFLDATCLESNIHYPVDWVLLKDGSRTLLKSIKLIRNKGLFHRIADPDKLLSELNQKAIAIGRCRGRDSRKKRKKLFRELRNFAKRIRAHGQRYRKLLNEKRNEVEFSDREVDEILRRMDNVIDKLPEAIDQAYNRIIHGIQANNKDKILTLYDNSTNVIIRGKSGAQTEFGCKLMLAEHTTGFIVDWQLYDGDMDDVTMTCDSVERMVDNDLKINSITGDRGCDGRRTRKLLEEKGIKNHICPLSVSSMVDKMQEEEFVQAQKRRAQTEARISIAKNQFIGNPIQNKEFIRKQEHVGWAILAHNLRLAAGLKTVKREEQAA